MKEPLCKIGDVIIYRKDSSSCYFQGKVDDAICFPDGESMCWTYYVEDYDLPLRDKSIIRVLDNQPITI